MGHISKICGCKFSDYVKFFCLPDLGNSTNAHSAHHLT